MPTLDGGGAPGLHPDRYSLDESGRWRPGSTEAKKWSRAGFRALDAWHEPQSRATISELARRRRQRVYTMLRD